jgi:hypothetical protein
VAHIGGDFKLDVFDSEYLLAQAVKNPLSAFCP